MECDCLEYVREIAALHGRMEVLQWVCSLQQSCYKAAAGGHLEVLQCARVNGCPWDEDTCFGAAAGGHLAVLQWARENGCPWDENALQTIIGNRKKS